jgi:hypothetical protein
MNPNEPEQVWKEFAERNGAILQFILASEINQDDFWSIHKEGQFKIEFISNSRMDKTNYCFPIHSGIDFSFEMHPRDFNADLLFGIHPERTYIQDAWLDEFFVYISNHQQLLKTFVVPIKTFFRANKMTNFFVKIKRSDVEPKEQHLLIEVRELLKNKVALETFFDLGSGIHNLILETENSITKNDGKEDRT